MRTGRAATSIALAVAGFSLVSAAAGRLARPPATDDVSSKFRYYEGAADRYDLLFLGSSHMARGIVPSVFDAELERRGVSVRSFNFGTLGMLSHEGNRLLGRVLDIGSARLRVAVIELAGWSPLLDERNLYTRRAIEWHDTNETLSVIRTALLQEQPLASRLQTAWTHLLHLGAYLLPAGRGRDAVEAHVSRDPAANAVRERAEAAWYALSGGHRPYADELFSNPSPLEGRREFVDEPERYTEAIVALKKGAKKLDSLRNFNTAGLAAQVSRLRESGVEPIYIVTPMSVPATFAQAALEAGLVPNAFLFNDAERYPEFYLRENRFDASHLGPSGAELFSAELARQLEPTIRRTVPRRARP